MRTNLLFQILLDSLSVCTIIRYQGSLAFVPPARHFGKFASVQDAVVIMDRDDPGRSRGFGFVTVGSMDIAQDVIRQTDGQDMMVGLIDILVSCGAIC